jgi:acetylornithine/N-succinyldiaminopimelate aminotransferase
MTAVVTTLDTIREEKLLENAAKVGSFLVDSLKKQLASDPGVAEIRGMGLMIGIELKQPCGELVLQGLEAGLVFNVTADNVIRLLPPLVMNEQEAGELVNRLVPLVKAFLGKRAAA